MLIFEPFDTTATPQQTTTPYAPQALGVGNEYVQEKRLRDLLQFELAENVRQEEARRYSIVNRYFFIDLIHGVGDTYCGAH